MFLNKENFSKIKKFLGKDVSDLFGPREKKVIFSQKEKNKLLLVVLLIFVFLLGTSAGFFFNDYLQPILKGIFSTNSTSSIVSETEPQAYIPQTSQEEAVINVVKSASPSVVSIIITKDLPVFQQRYIDPFEDFFGDDFPFYFKFESPQAEQNGTEEKEIGGGTGFIISEDGLILTNKHVASDEEASYTVVTNDGERYSAEILAKDPFQDLAILKIKSEEINQEGGLSQNKFPVLKLGDSSISEIGQTVITIGNALGEFRNTISAGVISGLGRTITASGGGVIETLEDIIQTDAAINKGNSGGPLLNLKGEVIGVNVAMAQDAQSIGFAIPINKAKRDIEQIKRLGKIVYPFLGVRYVLINPEVKEEKGLNVDYGVLIIRGDTVLDPAVIPDSAADKAGLKEGDIILEFNQEKITVQNPLAKIIQKYSPGETITLKILRGEKEIEVKLILDEKTDN